MSAFCLECPKRSTCTETCEAVEKALRKDGIYSADYIRPEISSAIRRKERKAGLYTSKFREIPFTDLHRDREGIGHDYTQDS